MQTGRIFDIQKFAIHDGPGIRTTVFFKGCPLSCWWCHNPEGISKSTQRIYRREQCIGCKECIKVCPNGAVVEKGNRLHWNAAECISCKTCAQVCSAEAVEFFGRTVSVEEIMAEIAKDTVFYDESRGGITISGGEPLMQPSFLIELLDACKKLELHSTVDTSGYAETQTLLEAATRTDLFLYDIKHMDSEKHVRFTGVSNERILTNLQVLSRHEAEIVIRFPIIPGFNSDQENIDKTGAFISSLPGVSRIHILPFHCAASGKYKNLGLTFNTSEVAKPTRDFLVSVARRLETYKLKVKIGG